QLSEVRQHLGTLPRNRQAFLKKMYTKLDAWQAENPDEPVTTYLLREPIGLWLFMTTAYTDWKARLNEDFFLCSLEFDLFDYTVFQGSTVRAAICEVNCSDERDEAVKRLLTCLVVMYKAMTKISPPGTLT